MDNGYKSNFKIEKYLKKLEFKRKLVEMMRPEWDGLIAEVSSEEEDLIEGYNFLTKAQKTRFIKFLRSLGEGCDRYIAENEAEWKAETARRRVLNKAKKNHQKRLDEISNSTGYKKRK